MYTKINRLIKCLRILTKSLKLPVSYCSSLITSFGDMSNMSLLANSLLPLGEVISLSFKLLLTKDIL